MAVYHGIGAVNATSATGITSTKDGLGAAASAATGYPVTDLDTIRQDTGWRPADSTQENSRLLATLDAQASVGAVVAAGLEEMIEPDDAYRIRWAKGFMEKPASAAGGKTDLAADPITHTASWTLSFLFRVNPMLLGADSTIVEVRNHATTSSSSTRLVQMLIPSTTLFSWTPGNLGGRVSRMSGNSNAFQPSSSAALVDSGKPYWVDVTMEDGSPSTATFYLNGVSIGTESVADAFGADTLLIAAGQHYIGGIWLHNEALSASQLTTYRYALATGREHALECGLNFSEASGTTVADIETGDTHPLTLDADSWSTITKPGLAYEAPARPRHQAYRSRAALQSSVGGATTLGELTVSPLVSTWFWFRLPHGPASIGEPAAIYFGTSSVDGNYDFKLSVRTTGVLRCRIDRFSGAPAIMDTLDVADAEWRLVSVSIGHDGAASLGIDGAEVASTAVAPAYTASAVSKLVLVASTSFSAEVAGPIVISRAPMTHAEMYAVATGASHLIPGTASDPGAAYLWSLNEATGTTAANTGAADDGVLTVTSTDWLPDAFDNPSPGSQIGNMADRPWQAAWEIAEGVNHDASEILLEIFAPAAATLTVYSLYILEVAWPEVGITGGQDSGTGPSLDITSVGVQRSEPGDTGRDVSYAFAALTHEEASNIRHHCLEARRTRRAGATSPMRPVALIYRAADPAEWAERCAILIPDLPRKQLDASQQTWEWSLTVGGREVRYGSNL